MRLYFPLLDTSVSCILPSLDGSRKTLRPAKSPTPSPSTHLPCHFRASCQPALPSLPGGSFSCPWDVSTVTGTSGNGAFRSQNQQPSVLRWTMFNCFFLLSPSNLVIQDDGFIFSSLVHICWLNKATKLPSPPSPLTFPAQIVLYGLICLPLSTHLALTVQLTLFCCNCLLFRTAYCWELAEFQDFFFQSEQ